jgi:hypothetical protein
VSVIVAAYAEAQVIASRLANLRALDYPPELLEVIVACDGSPDGTAERAREAGADVVLELPRGGKIRAQDAAVKRSQSEIVALSDQTFLMITRDSNNGQGLKGDTSLLRLINIVDLSAATDIAGGAFDAADKPVAPKGVLDPSVTPAKLTPFPCACSWCSSPSMFKMLRVTLSHSGPDVMPCADRCMPAGTTNRGSRRTVRASS